MPRLAGNEAQWERICKEKCLKLRLHPLPSYNSAGLF